MRKSMFVVLMVVVLVTGLFITGCFQTAEDYHERAAELREKIVELESQVELLKTIAESEDRVEILETQLKELKNQDKQVVSLDKTETLKTWKKFYQDVLGMDVDLSDVQIPDDPGGFERVIIIAKGLTPNHVFNACKDRSPTYSCHDDLDSNVPENDRVADKTYAIRVRDRVYADEELKNLSAKDLKEKDIKGITLLERLVLELEYFDETGKQLDISIITLCSGSRNSDGSVPGVSWSVGRLFVVWCLPGGSHSNIRARAVVSQPL